jgi:hypothetical protein
MALLARAIFSAKCAEKCHPLAWGEGEPSSGRSVEPLKRERLEWT